MLVKIINVSSFRGQFTNTLKISFEKEGSKFDSDTKETKEGGIELSGIIVDKHLELANLKFGDLIDTKLMLDEA